MKDSGTIEIFGLCGAGKTTILTDLVPILRSEASLGINVSFPIAPGSVHSICEALRITANALRDSPQEVAKFIAKKNNWWLPLKLGYRMAGLKERNNLENVLLIDSGVLQPFVSFDIDVNFPMRQVPIDCLISNVILPSSCIYVKASPDIAMERYLMRSKKMKIPVNKKNLKKRFVRANRTCEYILKYIRTRNVCTVVVEAETNFNQTGINKFISDLLVKSCK